MQVPRYLTRRLSFGFHEDFESRLSAELARLDREGYRVVSVVSVPATGMFRRMRFVFLLIAAVLALSLLISVVPGVLGWVRPGASSPFDLISVLVILVPFLLLPLILIGGRGRLRWSLAQMSFLIVAERKEP